MSSAGTATDTKTIPVTAVHIALGERSDCSRCPIALAVNAAFPGKTCVVTWSNVYIYPDENAYFSYINGEELARAPESTWSHDGSDFISLFDEGFTVEPQEVTLRLEKRNA
jgi:hypothetical protein